MKCLPVPLTMEKVKFNTGLLAKLELIHNTYKSRNMRFSLYRSLCRLVFVIMLLHLGVFQKKTGALKSVGSSEMQMNLASKGFGGPICS